MRSPVFIRRVDISPDVLFLQGLNLLLICIPLSVRVFRGASRLKDADDRFSGLFILLYRTMTSSFLSVRVVMAFTSPALD